MLGKQIYSLQVRADLSGEEKANIQKYKLGDTVLYQKYDMDRINDLPGFGGFMSAMIASSTQVELRVRSLEAGTTIDCKDILEMIGIEALIKEAAVNFKAILEASAKFGGEEVVEI
jgi:hypothetical protein